MFNIFDWVDEEGNSHFLIRKSKWKLILIILRVIFFMLIFIIFWWWVFKIKEVLHNEFYFVESFFGIALLALMFYYFIRFIVRIVSYFYDVFVVWEDKIYKFKVGFWFKENIEIIELYRVQEIRAVCDKFTHVLFDVGHVVLVENTQKERVIHRIDKPKQVVSDIQSVKDKLIARRRYKTNVENSKAKEDLEKQEVSEEDEKK